MGAITELFKKNIRQYGMIIALIFISIFFQIMTDGILLETAERNQSDSAEQLHSGARHRDGTRHYNRAH